MSFQIRSFDFRAMSNDSAGVSIGKLNEIIAAHTKVTEQLRELRREEKALDASIEETENGLALYKSTLSSEQLEEISNYLDSANDRLIEVIDQRDAAVEIRDARNTEIEQLSQALGIKPAYDTMDDGYISYCPVSEDALDRKAAEEYRFNTNATLEEMVEEYNNVVTNHLCANEYKVHHQRAVIYQAARGNGVKVVREDNGTLTIHMI